MSNVQHDAAGALLSVIVEATRANKLLSYQQAAEMLGRPKDHARMVAQACDLLDAAAALAGTPLLALIAVREKSGGINSKAWSEWGHRDEIIACSQQHKFSEADFTSIGKSLKNLRGRSNISAWRLIHETIPQEELLRRLTKISISGFFDAIDDIGSDHPEKSTASVTMYARDQKVRDAVKSRAGGKCEFCGEPGFPKTDGTLYLECHHIIALANDGADRMTNVIALCPNDHKEAHFGKRREMIEDAMIQKIRKLN